MVCCIGGAGFNRICLGFRIWDYAMRCLYVASEVAGFAKTGGLADVAAALPRALAERGHDCAVLMPLYRCIRSGPHVLTPTGLNFAVPMANRLVSGGLWR